MGGVDEELESQPLSGNQDTPCAASRDAHRLSMTAHKFKRAAKGQPNGDSDDDDSSDDDNDKSRGPPKKDDDEKITSDNKE